jgi:hypothetical protein
MWDSVAEHSAGTCISSSKHIAVFSAQGGMCVGAMVFASTDGQARAATRKLLSGGPNSMPDSGKHSRQRSGKLGRAENSGRARHGQVCRGRAIRQSVQQVLPLPTQGLDPQPALLQTEAVTIAAVAGADGATVNALEAVDSPAPAVPVLA